MNIRLLLAALSAFLVGGSAGHVPPATEAGSRVAFELPALPTPPRPAWEHPVVEALVRTVTVYRRPHDGAATSLLPSPRLDDRQQSFLVLDERPGWYRVLLPRRPNGSSGWLRAEDVRRTHSEFDIVVDVDDRRLTVRERGEILVTTRVVVGSSGTPTPRGRYFVTYAVRLQEPDGAYGPFAIGTSAFSSTLATFNGQPAQIALHGTNAPELLGTAASNGCIRMPNRVVRLLASRLTRGTPVTIT